jgi:fibronectin type 3 domain-containing protein
MIKKSNKSKIDKYSIMSGLFRDMNKGDTLMKRVITKMPRHLAVLMFITIMFTASLAFSTEVMNETFSQSSMEVSDGKVVGGEFVTLPGGEEGWRVAADNETAFRSDAAPSYIEYDIKSFNDINNGTIEFWVQRNREGGVYRTSGGNKETYDTVFELLGPDNITAISCTILWDYGMSVNESAIQFSHYNASTSGLYNVVWADTVPMGYKPAVGDWVHIALTFGDNAEDDNKVYINGKLSKKHYPVSTDHLSYTLFSDFLSRSDRLRIGLETGLDSSAYPGGISRLYRSVLSNLIIHDIIITEFTVDRFAFSGKPSGLRAEYVDAEVVLSWAAAKSTDTSGYNLYRKDLAGGDYVKINEDEVTETTFNDATAEDGKSYVYIAKGVSVDGAESNASNEAKITIVSEFYRVTETSTENDPTNLSGVYENGKITITWGAPRGITPSGYNVYRREGEGAARFTRLNESALTATSYADTGVEPGNVYYYLVTALNADGKEGKYPSEIKVEASSVAIGSVSIDPAREVRAGEEVTVTVSGTKGQAGSFSVAGVVDNVAMSEASSGIYYGTFNAPDGNIDSAKVTVNVGGVTKTASSTVTVDNYPPTEIIGLDIRNEWESELNIEWQSATEADFSKYNVYRSTEEITALVGLAPLVSIDNRDTTDYWDQTVTPNLTYYYAVTAVDRAGNISDLSSVVFAKVQQDTTLPVVFSVDESSKGVTLRSGDVLEITVEAETGNIASFNIGGAITNVALKEDERVGVYTGSYTVKDTDIVNDYVIVRLSDSSDNVSTYANDYKVNVDGRIPIDNTPPEIESISENSWSIAGFSGKLVTGDMLTVEMTGEPDGVALFSITGVKDKVKMIEDPGNPGDYIGIYTIQNGDYAEDTTVVGTLADAAGNVTAITASSKFSVDTNVNIEVTPSENSVPADEKTRIDVVAKVTDLNGDEVSGHKIKFTMTTTDEYTGIVGGGKYSEFKDLVGGKLRTEWRGETDAFGEVSAKYKAGFAAKTAIFLAKDLTTGNIGVGYLTSYVSASIDITLTQQVSQRRLRTVGRGVYINVTATPEKLTADGSSKSRIRAKVTDVRGQPVSGERVVFSMSSDNGKLAALDQVTDNRGIAEAVYTAGTEIGTVIITALDTSAGISGSTMVILMSDAPAKVYLSASPVTLPADGKSKADLKVKVSDVNDNPNQGAVVEYSIIKGRGSLDMDINETDINGETENGYRASHFPGTVTVEAKVTSRIPSEEESKRANGTIFIGDIYEDFETGEVKAWLKEVGDTIEKGEVVLRISTEMGEYDVTAKHAGTLYSIKKYARDDFDIGETLGIIEIE